MKAKLLAAMLILALVGTAAYAVEVNGILAQGEYAKEANFDNGNFRLLWSVVGDKLFMAIDAKAAGWVAVGFEPTAIMANADMVFGIVDASGKLKLIFAYSSSLQFNANQQPRSKLPRYVGSTRYWIKCGFHTFYFSYKKDAASRGV